MASGVMEFARLLLSMAVGVLMAWYIYSSITIVKIEWWMAAMVGLVTFLCVYLIFVKIIGRSGA